jgi:hypothetical protein
VNPGLNIETLAQSKFKKSVLDELKSVTGPLKLKPLIREYVERISEVQQAFRSAASDELTNSEKRLNDAVQRYKLAFPHEQEYGIVAIRVDENGDRVGDLVHLTGPLMDYLKHLQARTLAMTLYSQRRVEY